MTTHSLLLNSITFRDHRLYLGLHRQKETEQGHNLHHSVWLQAAPGGTATSQQVGWAAHPCWPACRTALGKPALRSDQVLVTAIQKKYGPLWPGDTNSCQHSGSTHRHLPVGSLEYTKYAFTYADWFFITVYKLREKQEIFGRGLSTTVIGGMEDVRNTLK